MAAAESYQMNSSDSESGTSLGEVKILHLVGSVESKFLYDLSLLYCSTSWENLTPEFPNSWLAVVTPERQWYITQTFENATSTTEPLSEERALQRLKEMKFDCVIPHMFCTEGMTTYRKHMEDIGIKLMGNPSHVCAAAHHKQTTKDIVGKAGVRVPRGLFLKNISDAPEDFEYPCIVKPCDLDNSVGVTFCENQAEYKAALEKVFKLTSDVLVEEYIKGEEVRCAVIETKDGGLRALPKIRYILDVPIRGAAQKLVLGEDKDGEYKEIKGYATKPEQVECPAILNDKQHAALEEAAKMAHKALGCQLYSLYDFRVTEDEVVMLEACLFCSFSPNSVLPTLARKENTSCVEFFRNMLEVRLSQ
jgi:D-alanine-D-alanine ligase